MELPNLGKRCADDHCKQLDFLPLQCRCGKIFCSEHLNCHAQTCTKSRFLAEDELKKIENIFVCSREGCKERSVVPLICQRCEKHFCIQHRHLAQCQEKSPEEQAKEKEKYFEPVKQFNKAKAVVDKQVENSLAEAKKKSKNKEMAAKLQLMKIKNKAIGQKNIPPADRVYFNIHIQSLGRDVPVFVSKTWSLGRVIDAVAEECKLQNNNHKGNEKKLRLFKKDDKKIVFGNLTATLSGLLADKVIVDGEDLIIEYVSDTCISL
ncbi:unnamed protein product [Ceutorhynchus assimilis]|uniref:ZFAND1-like ubiquitin-like domain-containing protein n=1 Tax=Ceutorhynchus assimilis TaxID=467358 RepID=A0A9N9QMP6_9CUCU|nr:unnamed protein product [Ceutorhynchus assimilis]